MKFILLIILSVNYHFISAKSCNEIPLQLSQQLKKGGVLLFGEFHGTKEIPAYFFDVVCNSATDLKNVHIGLEAPSELTPLLQQFIDSNEENYSHHYQELFGHDYWQNDQQQDGRKSIAMMKLLFNLRKLNSKQYSIRIFAFQPSLKPEQMMVADKLMAESLIKEIDQSALTFVLSGNVHTRNAHGIPGHDKYQLMGAFVREQFPHSQHILFKTNTGYIWGCGRKECGPQSLEEMYAGQPKIVFEPGFYLGKEANKHDWEWSIGKVLASKPAKTVITTDVIETIGED